MGAKVPLMVAQANEADNAADETPAEVMPSRAQGWLLSVSNSMAMASLHSRGYEQGASGTHATGML